MNVIGFGALNYDRLYSINRLAESGEEVPAKLVRESLGGSAANAIHGLARLGFETGFIGVVGNDPEGKAVLKGFSKEKVDASMIKVKEGRTSEVIGFINPNGERTLYVDPGVTKELAISDINLEYAKNTEFLHLSSFADEKQFTLQKNLVKKLSGVKISFCPGILYARKGIEKMGPIIKRSYIIFLNTSEVEALTGCDYEKGSEALLEKGASIVAVTLGEKGCYILDQNGSLAVDAYKTRVVDTTGAGDAFVTGFLAGLLLGKDLVECGKLGNKIASLCISRFGAREGLPNRKDVKEMI